jgi:outer membrane lipoprotein-sorting protein
MRLFPTFKFRFFTALALAAGVLAPHAGAEAAPTPVANAPIAGFAARFASPERAAIEGTVEITSNGVTARAKLQFQAPDLLRLEIEENAASQTRAQVIIARENETRFFDPATRRVQRLPFNVARQWWRGADLSYGGPANFLIFGLAPETLDKFYTAPADSAASTLALEARPAVEARFVNDYVRFGGAGDRISYAPFKRVVFDRPQKITLQIKDAGQILRSENNDGQNTSMALNVKNNVPQSVLVSDDKGREIANWKYTLAPRAAPFDAGVFSFDFTTNQTTNQIVEDALLKPVAEYSAPDASSKWNAGAALYAQAEDVPAALAAWDEAARLAPQATAPLLAIYEAAYSARDLNRAQVALDKLAGLLDKNSPELLRRRVALAIQKRDWSGAQKTLESALQAMPQNAERKLALAGVLRGRGAAEYSRGRDLLLDILKSDAPSSAQIQAVGALAEMSWGSGDEFLKLLPESATSTLWQKIARAAVLALQGKIFDAIETENVDALAILATLYERAGRDDAAIAAWEKVVARTPAPADRDARLHLVALHARRGEIAPSLLHYRELIGQASDLKTRREFQEFLIASWRKAFRQNQLRQVLQQRSVATAATEDDARLWLAFQENYGTSDDVQSAIQNGLARFTRSAWWRGRQAEYILAQVPSAEGGAARDRLQRQALDYAEQAAALDANQPYYAVGRAVILAQRATPITGIIEPGKYDAPKKLAFETLDALLQKWPGDPDVQLAVATQRLPLEGDGHHEATIALLQNALRGAAPNGDDRHLVSFAARQVLVSALRRQGQNAAVLAQYETLFRASRTVEEELGVAVNLLRLRLFQKNPEALARDLIYFAREPLSFEDSQQLLQPLLVVAGSKREIGTLVLASLRASDDPYARYLAALLAVNGATAARRIASQPEAPLDADRNLFAAEKTLSDTLQSIEPLAQSADRVLAARVAALEGEQALNANNAPEGEKWIARALEFEPHEANLRVALANARLAQNKIPETLAARDELLRALPHSFDTLQRATKLSDQIGATGDEDNLLRLSTWAVNAAQTDAQVSSLDFQKTALIAAHAGFYANKPTAATAVYNGLADEQWGVVDRAVVFLDWEATLRDMERVEQADQVAKRRAELALTPQQQTAAQYAWEDLN